MALFGKKKNAGVPEQPPVAKTPAKSVREIADYIHVNIAESMMKVELVDDGAYLLDCGISGDDKHIIIELGGILIADISNKTKAFKELKDKIGCGAKSVTITPAEGDYGKYYKVKLKFVMTEITYS